MTAISSQGLTDGSAEGRLLVLDAPLSLWGGLDLATGLISDTSHPQFGTRLSGQVLAMRSARGSSSSSSALVEAVRRETAPAAIIMVTADPILVIGSLVAADLYRREVPIVLVASADWPLLTHGALVTVTARDGTAEISVRQ